MTLLEEFTAEYGWSIGREGVDEYLYRCPKCGGTLRCNVSKGLAHCFKCGYAKKANGMSSTPPPSYNNSIHQSVSQQLVISCKLSDSQREYYTGRGIHDLDDVGFRTIPLVILPMLHSWYTSKELLEAGLLYTTSDGKLVPCMALQPGRTLIPYYQGTTILSLRTRRGPHDIDTPRYCHLPGTKATKHPFWYKKHFNDVLITEGEIKAIVASQNNYNCFSVPGINYSKICLENLRVELNKLPGRRFVVFDRLQGNRNLSKAVRDTCAATKAVPVFLYGADDLDEFFLQYGRDDFEELLEHSWMTSEKGLKWLKRKKNYTRS